MQATPLVEAEAMNASIQISMNSAIEEAYQKNVKANITLFTPVVTTITPPNLMVKIGENESEVTGTVADEAGRKLMLTKLGTLFPSIKFKDEITFNPIMAPTRLYATVLDPMADLAALEPSFILQSFGIVDGRLKFTGIVPESTAKDRLTGVILKRHSGKVSAEVEVDSSYLPSPDAGWYAKFDGIKITITGQLSSKQIKRELTTKIQATFPGWEVENEAEVIPSGLRRAAWEDEFEGLKLVAAPQQMTQLFWLHDTLTLEAKVPHDAAKAAMEARLHHTYGEDVKANIEVLPSPGLQGHPAVALIDTVIYFGATQRDFMAQELPKIQQVLEVLQANPTVKISIESHTDNKGSAQGNLNLSQLRADNVKKWLVRKGIDPERVQAKGNGFRKPVANLKSEDGRAACRRMEFHLR
jgi:outer membrane protein OmpA-like peptidoglycan-associated protein